MSERRSKMKPPRRSSQDSESSSSSESTSSASSEEEEVDARDLKPIKEYLNDRRELASQLFKSVKLEKIRMMLPQALKSLDLYDLEEYCGNELSGMSRKRILSIINGQRMAESSDTDETDDSGPSLEIISDTEEWLTDDDIVIKEENVSDKSKRKKQTDKVKGKATQLKDKGKSSKPPTINQAKNKKSSDISVKVEGEKPEAKEGESLLDLLELEMRARAIRALIRKEEDIIPNKNTGSTNATKSNVNTTTNANASTSKYVVQEMQQISVTLKQGSGLDDDVMLVIQPAPTIELLSSESENEKEKENDKAQSRVNKKLENERETSKEDEAKEKSNGEQSEKVEHSKRINKRLENERGTETTHSTSTIGDEAIENPDDDLKIEERLSNNNEKNETDIITIEKLSKSSENAEKTDQIESHKNTKSDKAEKSNELLDKSKCVDHSSEVSEASAVIVDDAKKSDTPVTTLPNKSEEAKIYETEEKKKSNKAKKMTESENTNSESKNAETCENSSEKPKSPEKELEDGELASDSDSLGETEVVHQNSKRGTSKRFRRHRRTKLSETSQEESENQHQSNATKSEDGTKLHKKIKVNIMDAQEINSQDSNDENCQNLAKSSDKTEEPQIEFKETEQNNPTETQKKQEVFDKTDMEEIIDLDDYPDDMDDLDNNQPFESRNSKTPTNSTDSKNAKNSSEDKTPLESSAEKSGPTETWASRYYNTDDVQNVIKESKIQSEIRKRLRERQRLSKLSNSPNANKTGSNSPTDIKIEEAQQRPLGSVEEYLALKAATAIAAESSVDQKSPEKSPDEKSRKSHRKRDKIKSHSSKRKLKSDKKSSKDDENSVKKIPVKTNLPTNSSIELRPD